MLRFLLTAVKAVILSIAAEFMKCYGFWISYKNVIKTIRDRKGDIMNDIVEKVISIAVGAAALAICNALRDDLENEVRSLCMLFYEATNVTEPQTKKV